MPENNLKMQLLAWSTAPAGRAPMRSMTRSPRFNAT